MSTMVIKQKCAGLRKSGDLRQHQAQVLPARHQLPATLWTLNTPIVESKWRQQTAEWKDCEGLDTQIRGQIIGDEEGQKAAPEDIRLWLVHLHAPHYPASPPVLSATCFPSKNTAIFDCYRPVNSAYPSCETNRLVCFEGKLRLIADSTC